MCSSWAVDVCEVMQQASISEWVECDDFNNDNPNSCKAWFRIEDSSLQNCDAFCNSLGYQCYEAYKEASETSECSVRDENEVSCSGPNDDDYVCGCQLVSSNIIQIANQFNLHKFKIFWKDNLLERDKIGTI